MRGFVDEAESDVSGDECVGFWLQDHDEWNELVGGGGEVGLPVTMCTSGGGCAVSSSSGCFTIILMIANVPNV